MAQATASPTRIANAGEIVVSWSEIAGLLASKTSLSQQDLDRLLAELVVSLRDDVAPGAPISSDLMKKVLSRLTLIEARLGTLEGTLGKDGDVVIIRLTPSDGAVKVGEQLMVDGKNFQFSQGLHRVSVDTQQVAGFLPGSGDEKLIFRIPLTLIDVPAAGRPAILTVSNGSSSAQRVIFLRPAIDVAGFFELNLLGAKPRTANTPKPGGQFTLELEIVSRANLDTSVDLSAVVTGPVNVGAWQKNVRILSSDETLLPDGRMFLKQSETKTFLVRLDPVPDGTNGTAFSLKVSAAAGSVVSTSGDLGFTVGTGAEQPDSTITLNFASGEIKPAGAVGSITAQRITLSSGAGAKLVLSATFEQIGDYDLSFQVPPNWQAQRTDGTPAVVTVAANEVAAGQRAQKILNFAIAPQANAALGQLTVKLQKQGQASSRSWTTVLATV